MIVRAVIIASIVAGAVAHADPAPWEAGVPVDRQNRAHALFAEANTLFAQQAHVPALDKYRAALALWDHPLIHFNAAVTLIRLDRVLEASTDLDAAMRFGDAPFNPELYRQALDYQRLLARQIATLQAHCDMKSIRVTLDGKPWFDCPGKHDARLLAGTHTIVATGSGMTTLTRRLMLDGGATKRESIELDRVGARPWYQRWYVVAGAGALVAGAVGIGIYVWTREPADTVDVHGSTAP